MTSIFSSPAESWARLYPVFPEITAGAGAGAGLGEGVKEFGICDLFSTHPLTQSDTNLHDTLVLG